MKLSCHTLSHIVMKLCCHTLSASMITAATSFCSSIVTIRHEMQRGYIILITRDIAMLPIAQCNVADVSIYHIVTL